MSHLQRQSLLVTHPPIQHGSYNKSPQSLPEITAFHRPSSKRLQLIPKIWNHEKILLCMPGPESIKNQESEKSPKEIIRAKKEQGEEKQDSTYSIRSTDIVNLEEFDLKSALFKHMNKIKSANRNTTNYHLYHALMEALITDEDVPWIRKLQIRLKITKRKHDSDDDEDDD
ncbi:hypothetical protein Tco_0072557 [Tanacetum coccineum]